MTYPYHQQPEPEPRPTPPPYGMGHPHTPPPGTEYPATSPTSPPSGHGPPPIPPKRRRGRIIGGVVATILVLAGVATTLVITGVVDFGEKPKIEKPKEKDQTYGFLDDMCDTAKLDAIEETVSPVTGELTDDFTDYKDFGVQSCHGQLYSAGTQTYGSVSVNLTVFDKASNAKELFDADGTLINYDLEDFDGDWLDGKIGRSKGSEYNEFGATVVDGNMHLSVKAGIVGIEPDETEALTEIAQTVTRVQEVSRNSDMVEGPSTDTGEKGEVEGDYAFVDDLCEKVDWSVLDAFPFESLDGGEYEPDVNVTGTGVAKCDNGSFADDDLKKNAAVLFKVETKKNSKGALDLYEKSLDGMDRASESVRDIDGEWDQGKFGEGGSEIPIDCSVLVLADNAVVKIALNYWGEDKGTQKDAEKALLDLAEQALELSRK